MSRDPRYPDSVVPGIPKLGMMPSGWRRVRFGDVLHTAVRPVALANDQPYQLVTARRSRGGIVARDVLYGRDIRTMTQFVVRSGDFLISRRQIVHGACGLVPEHLDGAVVSNEYAAFRARDGLDLAYLTHYSHTVYFQQTCFHASVGVDIEKMVFKLEEWLAHELYLPPLPEQRKIAEILSTWDEALALLDRRIELAQERKKGLAQRLLTGRVRFPEFEGEGWREVRLGEVFRQRNERGYDGLPLLSVTAEDGIVYRDELDRRDTSNSDKSKYLRVCEGDIAYNTMRMWQGRFGISDHEGIVSPAYTVCIPKPSVDVKFMGYLLELPDTVHLFRRFSQGLVSDTWNLKYDDFARIRVRIPDLPEQRRIAEVLQTCDEEIALLRRKRELTAEQKKGLMQRLLTGRVRVRVATAKS